MWSSPDPSPVSWGSERVRQELQTVGESCCPLVATAHKAPKLSRPLGWAHTPESLTLRMGAGAWKTDTHPNVDGGRLQARGSLEGGPLQPLDSCRLCPVCGSVQDPHTHQVCLARTCCLTGSVTVGDPMTLTRGRLFLGCPLSPTGSPGALTLQVRTGQACGDLAGQFPAPRGHHPALTHL